MNAHSPIDTVNATPVPVPAVPRQDLPKLAAGLVAAYVRGNRLPAAELPGLIQLIHATLRRLADPSPKLQIVRPTEAQIRASVQPDRITSFEDGKPYKALRRHLTLRGLSPEAYRTKWGLPVDYPMVAASYSAVRSEISRANGLGTKGGATRPAPTETAALAGAEA